MSAPVIEKGVPLPTRGSSGIGAALKWMEIGDSVVFPTQKINGVHKAAKVIGVKIVTRKTDIGRRVWRVA